MSYWLEARYHLSKQSLAWNISNPTNTYSSVTDFLLVFWYGSTKPYWLHSGIKAQLDGCKHTIAYNTFIFETCLTNSWEKSMCGAQLDWPLTNKITFYFSLPPHTSCNFSLSFLVLWSYSTYKRSPHTHTKKKSVLGSLRGRRLNGSSWTEKFKQVTINDLVTDLCKLLADSSYYNLIFCCFVMFFSRFIWWSENGASETNAEI